MDEGHRSVMREVKKATVDVGEVVALRFPNRQKLDRRVRKNESTRTCDRVELDFQRFSVRRRTRRQLELEVVPFAFVQITIY